MSSLQSLLGKKNLLRFFFSLLAGVGLFLLVYRSIDVTELQSYLFDDRIRWDVIGGSIVLGVLANLFHGLRWRLLIEPFSTPAPRRLNAVLTSWGCFAVNLLFPRAGEIWRCFALARRENLPFPKLLGTLFMDRLVDMLSVVFLFVGCLMLFREELGAFFSTQNNWGERFRLWFSSPIFWLILTVFSLLVILLLVGARKKNLWQKLRGDWQMVIEGLRSIRSLAHPWQFVFYTVLTWLCYYYAFSMTFMAFPFTQNLSWEIAFLGFIMGTIGVVAPVQSGIGAWHFMVITTLTLFGVTRQDAGFFALVVHSLQTVGNALVGFFAILVLPLLNRNYNRTAK